MSIYDYVKSRADALGYNIVQVEMACELGNGTISGWKKSVPKANLLYRVAKFLNCPIDYFLTGEMPEVEQFVIPDKTEEILIEAYRNCDALGKAKIIQVCLNEMDKSKNKKAVEFR